MTVTVEWTATALLNLADILDYVREQSPLGADTLAVEIQDKTGRIAPIRSCTAWAACVARARPL